MVSNISNTKSSNDLKYKNQFYFFKSKTTFNIVKLQLLKNNYKQSTVYKYIINLVTELLK